MGTRRVISIALLAALALNVLLVLDLVTGVREVVRPPAESAWWGFDEVIHPSDSMADVIQAQQRSVSWRHQLYGMAVGLAAREIADGPADKIVVPEALETVDLPASQGGYARIDFWYTRLTSLGVAVPRSYDPVLDDGTIAAFQREGRVVRIAWDVYAVMGDSPERTVAVFTDSDHLTAYVVPQSLIDVDVTQ